jgi:hypothetical protein
MQFWSEHQTDLAAGAALLLLLVLLGWTGRRRSRRNVARRAGGPAGRTGERQMRLSLADEEDAPATTHDDATPVAPRVDLAPEAQALLDKAARLVDSQILGAAQTLPSTPAPSVSATPCEEPADGPVPRAASCPLPAPPASPVVVEAAATPVCFALDGPAPLPPPVVEELPAAIMRSARDTPRVPTLAVSTSIGAYRMVRPSEPEVLTPRPVARPAELSLSTKRRSEVVTPVPLTRASGGDADLPAEPPEPRTPGGTLLGIRPAR